VRYAGVKTVRFSKVVEKCGPPEAYLVLMAPTKDKTLQAAVKAQRVMTISQETVGTKTDRGEVGFHPGRNRQFLVFPKSLRPFAGCDVVGIKYDLLSSSCVPKSKRAAPPKPPKKPKFKPAEKVRPQKTDPPAVRKVVAFRAAAEEEEEDETISAIKRQVRHAMAVLEEGKPVAAFNLLKRIVEN
jgi:hypothetical protein